MENLISKPNTIVWLTTQQSDKFPYIIALILLAVTILLLTTLSNKVSQRILVAITVAMTTLSILSFLLFTPIQQAPGGDDSPAEVLELTSELRNKTELSNKSFIISKAKDFESGSIYSIHTPDKKYSATIKKNKLVYLEDDNGVSIPINGKAKIFF